jgi:predicted MFS family arabinose efflux permease
MLLLPVGLICFGAATLVDDKQISLSQSEVGKTLTSVAEALRSRELRLAALFLFLFMCSPGFNVPLYFHLTNKLQFSQQFIGSLGAIAAVGSVVGAGLYAFTLGRLDTPKALYAAIGLGVSSTMLYLLLNGYYSAIIIYFLSGMVQAVTVIATATLAAEFCPPRCGSLSYAILAAIENIAFRVSDISGSALYDHVLQRSFGPLVLVSAAFTGIAVLFVPMIKRRRAVRSSLATV